MLLIALKYFHSIQAKKKAFFAPILEKQKHFKKAWQTINTALGKTKNHSCTSLSIRRELSTGDAEIANHFNKHFATIGSDLGKNMNHTVAKFGENWGSSYPHCMNANNTFVSEIKNMLSGMQPKTSRGLDINLNVNSEIVTR